MKLLKELLAFSTKYQISIQFWPDQTAVYISKGDIELFSSGGDHNTVISHALNYLQRITNGR